MSTLQNKLTSAAGSVQATFGKVTNNPEVIEKGEERKRRASISAQPATHTIHPIQRPNQTTTSTEAGRTPSESLKPGNISQSNNLQAPARHHRIIADNYNIHSRRASISSASDDEDDTVSGRVKKTGSTNKETADKVARSQQPQNSSRKDHLEGEMIKQHPEISPASSISSFSQKDRTDDRPLEKFPQAHDPSFPSNSQKQMNRDPKNSKPPTSIMIGNFSIDSVPTKAKPTPIHRTNSGYVTPPEDEMANISMDDDNSLLSSSPGKALLDMPALTPEFADRRIHDDPSKTHCQRGGDITANNWKSSSALDDIRLAEKNPHYQEVRDARTQTDEPMSQTYA